MGYALAQLANEAAIKENYKKQLEELEQCFLSYVS